MASRDITDAELAGLEQLVQQAIDSGDESALHIIGSGEFSVALGWPSADPSVVCKRSAPMTRSQSDNYGRLLETYIERLTEVGVKVAPTEYRTVDHRSGVIGWMIQPLFPRETMGDVVLNGATPNPEHPLLLAVAHSLSSITDRLSHDAQVNNWSWDGTELTLIDLSTPLTWDASGRLELEMDPMARMLPAVTRPFAKREMAKVAARWKTRRAVAVDVVANLLREGLDSWVEPAIGALHQVHPDLERVTRAEAQKMLDRDKAVFPTLKRLQKVERAWQTTVRRRPFDFLLQDGTFG